MKDQTTTTPTIISSNSSSSGLNKLASFGVSDWFDADSYRIFTQTVRSGDILESRNNRCSHWGVAVRLKQSPSTKSKSKPAKPMPDEIMVYHLIHSSKNRGQVGQYTLEEFWHPDCRVRINNTTNGSSLYGATRTIPKSDVLHNAFTAHLSTQLKWQTCADFIRWSSEEMNYGDDNASNLSNHSSSSCSSNPSH